MGCRRYPRHLIYTSRGQAEQSYTATHEPTGLLVKVRSDLLTDSPKRQRRPVVDFKTTSCRDLAQFLTTIEKCDYDRQAALYLDVLGATRFLIIGVQKPRIKAVGQAPHDVWRVELTATPGLIEQGRKKYASLLRHYARQAVCLPTPTAMPAPLAYAA